MPKLKWDQPGQHFYENGICEVALFVMDSKTSQYGAGNAWDGVTNVTVTPEGAEPTNLYANNRKYLTMLSAENVNASIECYTFPDEFYDCLGMYEMLPGMRVAQQAHKTFALCFKTGIGSDANPNLGFKFHVLYSCVASPSEKAYNTINEDPEAMTLSFELSTTPVEAGVEGFNAFSYLEFKSTDYVDAEGKMDAKFQAVLDAFYGADGEEAVSKLLLPNEIYAMLKGE